MIRFKRHKRAASLFLIAVLVGLLGYASVGLAALTFNSTAITSGGALTITGVASSTWDLGSGNTLSLQIDSNAPITTGTGLLTVGGRMAVGASSSFQGFTFTTATGTSLNLSATGVFLTVSSTNIAFNNATGTSLFSTSGGFGTVSSTGVVFTNATGTNFTITTLLGTLASSTGITFTNATGTNLAITGTLVLTTPLSTVSSTGVSWQNATGTTLTVTNASSSGVNFVTATGTRIGLTTVSSTDISYINATGTNLFATTGGFGTVSSTNIAYTNATGTSLFSTSGGFGTVSSTGVVFTNATGTNITASVLDNAGTITIGGTGGTNIIIGRSGQVVRFPGNASTTGSLAIATSGTPIVAHYSATSSVGFGTVATSSCNEVTVTLGNVAVGDTVLATNSSSSVETGLTWSHYISAADTVKVRGCNVSWAANAVHTTSTFRFDIWKH